MMPFKITDYIAHAKLGATEGVVIDSNIFNTTSGSWVTSPITITDEPTVNALNATTFKDQEMIAKAMNSQTKMSNLNAPPAVKNILFLYANNNGDLRYEIDIPLDFGVDTFDSVQISNMLNICTSGDEHGNIQVFDFGSGTWTGTQALKLVLSGNYGPIHLAIRLNKQSSNATSHFIIYAIVLPVDSENLKKSVTNTQLTQINGENEEENISMDIIESVCDKTIVVIRPRRRPCVYIPSCVV